MIKFWGGKKDWYVLRIVSLYHAVLTLFLRIATLCLAIASLYHAIMREKKQILREKVAITFFIFYSVMETGFLTKQFWFPLISIVFLSIQCKSIRTKTIWLPTFFKKSLITLCSTEERKSHRFEMTWGWVNDDWMYLFGGVNHTFSAL